MSKEYIATVLKRLRIESGLTADQVGEKVGKSGKTVNGWENARSQPDAEILLQLCDIYGVKDIMAEFSELRDEVINDDFYLSHHEKNVITAYRTKPEMQPAVDKLLGIDENLEIIALPRAARSKDNKPVGIATISKEQLDRLDNAQPVTDEEDI